MKFSRRRFAARAAGSMALPALFGTLGKAARIEAEAPINIDIAEWSYFWVGHERASLAKGTYVGGKQMYVEYWIPSVVKHPIPMLLVHGEGSQGLEWMGTPDERPGLATQLLQQGYKVYVLDLPGHGRSPYHPDLHGPFPKTAPTLESISEHLGPRELDQFVASQGGSYVAASVNAQAEQMVWRERGAMVLDKIGPAVIVAPSGMPFGSLVAEARPNLVKGIVAVDGITDWIEKNAPKNVHVPAVKRTDSTAMKLSDIGYFWVGTDHKKMPYGTILTGQAYVQYLIPREVRHETPILLVHGGTGQMLHYMGTGDGLAGWAHYYAQNGYKVYLIDRPGHGRSPYHPDALGTIGPQPMYGAFTADFRRSARGPNRQWMGTGDEGDPLVDQFMASQNATQQNNTFAHGLWATRGAEILDKVGPMIIQVHGEAGPFGYLVANERPGMVKAIVNVEGGGAPFEDGNVWGVTDIPLTYEPPVSNPPQLQDGTQRQLTNLKGIPIVYVTGEVSGRTGGAAHVEFLKQAGCSAEHLALKDKGIRGNGHFMMLENNRKQVFETIRSWVETKTA